ncbi:MAG: hypothetical protein Q4B77_05710 [Coriobacteriaceae bacterium]|nr:hypothetical protein [Coriobacteriaceae bacterium]
MAFDPMQEDCLRLILASMERDGAQTLEDASYIEQAANQYQVDPSALIKTDRDRSFHLVAKAAELIDYRAPFAPSEADAEACISTAESYLTEAVELDASNWDAQRMLATVQARTEDELVSYLLEHRDEVGKDTQRLMESASNPFELEFARDLGRRPHQRWLAALASRLLISGQYRMALTHAEMCLKANPLDLAGARHTGMLALAKLEVAPEELAQWRSRHATAYQQLIDPANTHLGGHTPDAWSLLAELSIRYRSFDFEGATEAIRSLMRIYPHAAQSLYFQAEFPDGVFGRVRVQPGSDDELVLALSEATPLLQEGMGTPEAASLALWVSEHELVQQELVKDGAALDFDMQPNDDAKGDA